ncbi:hypothetical protein WJX81_006117 [Elliptochloris bilobata]|uniref:SMP-30/Gluconolactonase/LRE-like region domain-containing protein n=1 Tax=Elliptochloris bilobata TaxID=381761 RepID=A0AAW1RI00_9CHLO
MAEPTVDLALDARTILGESPVWDDRIGRLYFVDINERRLHAWEPQSGERISIEAPEQVGCVALTNDTGKVLLGLHRRVVVVDVASRALCASLATTPDSHGIDDMRFNDGKGAPDGALIIGRMHSKWREGKPGRLYRLAPPGELQEVLEGTPIGLPNGMAWDMERREMYFVDSKAQTITAFATDEGGVPLEGAAGRLVATVPSEEGVPDGMTIDRTGNLWVALGEAGAVTCFDAQSGAQLHRVALPVGRPTACTFGGADLAVLYVTTREEKGPSAAEHWGGVFAVRVPGVAGRAGGFPVRLPA